MSKVVNLTDFKKEELEKLYKDLDSAPEDKKKDIALKIFKEAERRNKENEERLLKERKKRNEKIKKQFRLNK